jgi:hypothetical protein
VVFFDLKAKHLASTVLIGVAGLEKTLTFALPFKNGRDPKLKHNGKNQIGPQRPQKTRFV